MAKYLLDANVLIEAKRRYYAFDLCPGFWNSLIEHHIQDHVFSIDHVMKELEKGEDDLSQWAKSTIPASFFVDTQDGAVLNMYGQMQVWASNQQQYQDGARAKFASNADAWLVAMAKTHGFDLVTHEQPSRDARKEIPIPNVCVAYGVRCIDTFVMLRELRVSFGWDSTT